MVYGDGVLIAEYGVSKTVLDPSVAETLYPEKATTLTRGLV
jgi:hypothetical protein